MQTMKERITQWKKECRKLKKMNADNERKNNLMKERMLRMEKKNECRQ